MRHVRAAGCITVNQNPRMSLCVGVWPCVRYVCVCVCVCVFVCVRVFVCVCVCVCV